MVNIDRENKHKHRSIPTLSIPNIPEIGSLGSYIFDFSLLV